MQIITDVREMAKTGYIRLDKIDATLHVAEGIEEKLNQAKKEQGFVEVLEDLNNHKSSETQELDTFEANLSSEKSLLEMHKLKEKLTKLDSHNRELKQVVAELKIKLERVKKIVA